MLLVIFSEAKEYKVSDLERRDFNKTIENEFVE